MLDAYCAARAICPTQTILRKIALTPASLRIATSTAIRASAYHARAACFRLKMAKLARFRKCQIARSRSIQTSVKDVARAMH